MALVESNLFKRGMKVPDFLLQDTISGKDLSLASLKGKNYKKRNFLSGEDVFSDAMRQKQREYTLVLKVNDEMFRIFWWVVSENARF